MAIKLGTSFVRGLPDRLLLLPLGRVYFIETKSTGDDPSKLQRFFHRKLMSMGFRVLILDTVEGVKEFFEYNT